MRKYVPRLIEDELKKALKEFPVVVVTGPRQTGKSTLLQKAFSSYSYVTLDDPLTRKIAQDDPKFFLTQFPKLIIDEIQHTPELLPYIKLVVDQNRSNTGRFLLTGSQVFPLMAGLSESLAGRAALYELMGLSFLETPRLNLSQPASCFEILYQGFFPDVLIQGVDRNRFYASYIQTYLERDIRQITSVHDLKVFQTFLELLAARAGNLLNLHEVSNECGVSYTTARRWLSLLETTRIIYLLRPYTKNITKRIIKSPKIYFTDTGLLSYLLRYPNAATLRTGPHAGAFFENLIILELLKKRCNHNLNFELYFYRDSNHSEVDLVLDCGPRIVLAEIKTTMTPQAQHFDTLHKVIRLFRNSHGFLLSFAQQAHRVTKETDSLPWQDILSKVHYAD